LIACSFTLNSEPLSKFNAGSLSFPAYSGLAPYINKRSAVCTVDLGPLPPGDYYIFDRQSGGFLGSLYDAIGRRDGWFALHAIDGKIDDETYCNNVKRGAFRLHPKGATGNSRGCIVIEQQADFNQLRAFLTSVKPQPIKGSNLLAYGKVTVK
jgi:hypothetical protein